MPKKMVSVCVHLFRGLKRIPFNYYAVPNPPSNVLVKRLNASHMMVSWTALTLKEARGHITHYTVYYRLASNNLHVFSAAVPQNTTEVIISDLLPGETYVVEISASTSVGEGSTSMEVYSTLTQGD